MTDMSVNDAPGGYEASIGDYFALMKPRVMSLVIFTGLVGMLAAPAAVHPVVGFAAILCISIGAGASGALNMWWESDIDGKMGRTKGRPIPSGRVTRDEALGIGLGLSVLSVAMLAVFANPLSALLLAGTIAFYGGFYTMWLKRRTPQNIVIGGAAGAIPPVIGWTVATGSIAIEPLLMFAIILLWTPPHFWALALYKTGDYGKVGIPMMPNVKGPKSTRNQIMAYSVLLAVIAIAPIFTGLAGNLYAAFAVLLNIGFLALALKVWTSRAGETAEASDEASLYEVKSGDRAARNLFAYSIIYLFATFGVLAAEGLLKLG